MIKPYYEEPDIKIYQGHILEVLKTLGDESVNTIITSPPYWGLRDYGEDTKTIWDGDPSCEHKWIEHIKPAPGGRPLKESNVGRWKDAMTKNYGLEGRPQKSNFCSKCGAWYGQLGLEPTLDLYINHLLQVTLELKRVLRKDGIMFWNQGDSYGGSGGSGGDYDIGGLREGQPKVGKAREGIQAKCLALQNFRLIIKMIDEQGWILRNNIIWNKPNHMPTSVKDRFANGYEPVFMLIKNNDPVYYYNVKTGLMADRKAKEPRENIDWEWRDCPNCKGTGKIEKEKETKIEEQMAEEMGSPRARYHRDKIGECKRCKGTGKIKYSFWRALDYWFDLDAVRLPHKSESLERVKGKWNGHREPMSSYQGMDIKKMCDPSGKNPGDVWEVESKWDKKDTGKLGFASRQTSKGLHRNGGGVYHLAGKNPADVWKIPTQPFPEAHFATFPEKLVSPMILAGCPQWVCKKCGKARVRIVKPTEEYAKLLGKGYIDQKQERETAQREGKPGSASRIETYLDNKPVSTTAFYQTIGWTDCGCNAGWDLGVLLDPFMGRGTVGIVGKKLSRGFIGIDIKKEYCDMSIKEIKNITPSLPFQD